MFSSKQKSKEEKETEELENKVESILKGITQASVEVPEAILISVARYFKEHPEITPDKIDINKVLEMIERVYKELPNITTIMQNYATILSTYANYRTSKREEKLAEAVLNSNKIMAYASIALVAVTAITIIIQILSK